MVEAPDSGKGEQWGPALPANVLPKAATSICFVDRSS